MRTLVLLSLVGLAAGAFLTPTAAAGSPCPDALDCHVDCLQVYPWSRLCEGDVGGFLEAYVGDLLRLD